MCSDQPCPFQVFRVLVSLAFGRQVRSGAGRKTSSCSAASRGPCPATNFVFQNRASAPPTSVLPKECPRLPSGGSSLVVASRARLVKPVLSVWKPGSNSNVCRQPVAAGGSLEYLLGRSHHCQNPTPQSKGLTTAVWLLACGPQDAFCVPSTPFALGVTVSTVLHSAVPSTSHVPPNGLCTAVPGGRAFLDSLGSCIAGESWL